jgi:thiol-disulfide isomerase/thioredoxin
VAVGSQLPGGCRLEALGTGAVVTLADYAGSKPIVLNFWASWCGACIKEMPELQKVIASRFEGGFTASQAQTALKPLVG